MENNGELGKRTKGEPIDQLKNLIHQIKTNPNSRRLILSSWSPEFTPQMALPPCHTLFQFYVHDGKLSCQLMQRVRFPTWGTLNIASYVLVTHLIVMM